MHVRARHNVHTCHNVRNSYNFFKKKCTYNRDDFVGGPQYKHFILPVFIEKVIYMYMSFFLLWKNIIISYYNILLCGGCAWFGFFFCAPVLLNELEFVTTK